MLFEREWTEEERVALFVAQAAEPRCRIGVANLRGCGGGMRFALHPRRLVRSTPPTGSRRYSRQAVCVTRIGVARPIRRLPGIVGMVLLAVGVLQKIGWVKVLGLVLAAPVFWCYFGVIFIFLPLLIIDKLRRGRGR